MKDSLSFPLLLATVFAGALLAIFDPANRATTVAAAKRPATLSPAQPPATLLASDMPS